MGQRVTYIGLLLFLPSLPRPLSRFLGYGQVLTVDELVTGISKGFGGLLLTHPDYEESFLSDSGCQPCIITVAGDNAKAANMVAMQ